MAVLPYDADVKIRGETADYAWRVNRGHVVTMMLDTPASELKGYEWNSSAPSGPMRAGGSNQGLAGPSMKQDILCDFPPFIDTP